MCGHIFLLFDARDDRVAAKDDIESYLRKNKKANSLYNSLFRFWLSETL